jgi:folate-binding Fe-S cluster repair protein YgfZ
MLSRKERIDEFQFKLSRTEKELYEEFLKTEEAELVLEMQQYLLRRKVTPVASGSIIVSGRKSKTEWGSGSRRFVQTGIKTKT